MDWKIQPADRLFGEIRVPADKSITHRAIMLAAIAEGDSVIENYLPAEDCMNTLEAFRKFGVAIDRYPDRLVVHGKGFEGLRAPAGDIDAGNSGTTTRLLAGICAGREMTVRITGDASLSRRPMKRIMEPLGRMGVRFSAKDGNYLPLEISGTRDLKPIRYTSAVASAQVKSSILFAGLQAEGLTSVKEPLRSRDHTERMLAARGADISVKGTRVSVRGPAIIRPLSMSVPADISSAAFFMVAAAIVPSAKLVLPDIGINPTRDGIIEVLKNMGARISVFDESEVSGEPIARLKIEGSELSAVTIGGDIMPRLVDEVPVIVLAATQARGATVISGAAELRVKESDRLRTIASELGKMGAAIEERPDGLIINGPTRLRAAAVESYGDHRIALTLAVAGLVADGETVVRDVDCVKTSYPSFWEQFTAVRGDRTE